MATGGENRDKDTKPANLAAAPKLNKVTLADGKVYELANLDLNMLCEFEDAYPDKAAADLIGTGKLKYIRYLILLRLKPNYPDMTIEQVGKLITLDVLINIRKDLGL